MHSKYRPIVCVNTQDTMIALLCALCLKIIAVLNQCEDSKSRSIGDNSWYPTHPSVGGNDIKMDSEDMILV